MEIVAAIFDYDGTLVDLNIDFYGMRKEIEQVLSVHGLDVTIFRKLYVLEMIDEAARVLTDRDRSAGQSFFEKAHELVISREVAAAQSGRVLPGSMETLKTLKNRGIKVGIITRNCDQAVRVVLPQIEILCDAFVPRDRIARVKPHPDHLTLALKMMGVADPAACLMVGDHVIDIESGKRMGTKTAGVLTGNTTRQQFMEAGADFILGDATEVAPCIFEGIML